MTIETTTSRAELVRRFLDLRPQVDRRFAGEFERELHHELQHVTFHQLSTLRQLQDGPLSMRELARRMGVSESAATAIADRLVRQGLVGRQSDPADRRVVRLALSESGHQVIAAVQRAATAKMRKMLEVLSDVQLAQLVDIYETLRSSARLGEAAESAR